MSRGWAGAAQGSGWSRRLLYRVAFQNDRTEQIAIVVVEVQGIMPPIRERLWSGASSSCLVPCTKWTEPFDARLMKGPRRTTPHSIGAFGSGVLGSQIIRFYEPLRGKQDQIGVAPWSIYGVDTHASLRKESWHARPLIVPLPQTVRGLFLRLPALPDCASSRRPGVAFR